MNMNEYQDRASETNIYPAGDDGSMAILLGICGEAGEVADKVKKRIRDQAFNIEEIAYELGDLLWYVSQFAGRCGYTLEQIAQMNLDKLASRAERGKIGGSGDDR